MDSSTTHPAPGPWPEPDPGGHPDPDTDSVRGSEPSPEPLTTPAPEVQGAGSAAPAPAQTPQPDSHPALAETADDPLLPGWMPPEQPRPVVPPGLTGPRKGRRLRAPEDGPRRSLTPGQRLLLLDTWERSSLPAKDFAALVGLSPHTLYVWRRRFRDLGPEGLADKPRGVRRGSRLPELTKRAILLIKRTHTEYGCQRISDLLARGPALAASAGAVARVLKQAGYTTEDVATTPNAPKPRRFESDRPSRLWQSDLFTFRLKRQNRDLHLVAFLDDHSRFITTVDVALHASTPFVIEALRRAVADFGPPAELLTDRGPQYATWRGRSALSKECERLGINHILSRAGHPQTLGKTERFWGTLWREFLKAAVFRDVAEARERIGHFVDHYNFQRPHRGIEGLVPADRFFGASDEVRRSLEERIARNAREIALHGKPKTPFYLTGQSGGAPFSMHTEGERLILTRADGTREEIDPASVSQNEPVNDPEDPESGPSQVPDSHEEPALAHSPGLPSDAIPVPPPGSSPLDNALAELIQAFRPESVPESSPELVVPSPSSDVATSDTDADASEGSSEGGEA